MATARQRAQRLWIYQQAAMVWKPLESQLELNEFIRCGAMGGHPVPPDSPEVKEKIAEILREGKLIVNG